MDGLIKLFVYGSLLRTDVRQRVLGNDVPHSPDILPGYRTVEITLDQQPVLTVEYDRTSETNGEVLLLAAAQLAVLDSYEPPDYERREVQLKSGRTAWVYLRS